MRGLIGLTTIGATTFGITNGIFSIMGLKLSCDDGSFSDILNGEVFLLLRLQEIALDLCIEEMTADLYRH